MTVRTRPCPRHFLTESHPQFPEHLERVDVVDAERFAHFRDLDDISCIWRRHFMGNNRAMAGDCEGYQPAVRS